MFRRLGTDKFVGILVKGRLAPFGAKIVRLSLIVRLRSSGLGIDIHSAYGVFNPFIYAFCSGFILRAMQRHEQRYSAGILQAQWRVALSTQWPRAPCKKPWRETFGVCQGAASSKAWLRAQ